MAIKKTYTAVLFLKKYLLGAWITEKFISSDFFTLWKYYIRKLQSNVSNLYGYANAGKNKFKTMDLLGQFDPSPVIFRKYII